MGIPPQFYYAVLMAASILFPLLLSFDKKVHFYSYWWRLFIAMAVGSGIFIFWDYHFTKIGIWQFNQQYILGIKMLYLPIEEWLFFIIIPYCCFFIYQCNCAWLKPWMPIKAAKFVYYLLLISSVILAIVFFNRLYTFFTFGGLFFFLIVRRIITNWQHWQRFLEMWLLQVIPFFVVNGVLTSVPIVIYNNAENLNVRIFSVPLEDAFYGMLLLLIIHTVYVLLENYTDSKRQSKLVEN